MILFSVDSVLNFLVIADLFIQLLIPVIVDVIMVSSYQNLFPFILATSAIASSFFPYKVASPRM